MITKQTTFVLGAGASMAYGFPSGKTLKALIWKHLSPLNLPSYFHEAYSCNMLSGKNIKTFKVWVKEFLDNLVISPDETIDYFLEHVSEDYYRQIGRLGIAYILLTREQRQYLFDSWMDYHARERSQEQENFFINAYIRPDDGHWYQFLFNQMCRDCPSIDDFAGNQVSFITFNYDRSFECYFLHALMAKYKVKVQEAAEIWNKFEIVHVYGKLGELPDLVPNNEKERKQIAVPYSALNGEIHTRVTNLRNAADGIKLIWDGPEENENIKNARKLIYKNDNIVIFLGFGYDPTNLERIMPQKEIDSQSNMRSHGTIYGLSKQRLQDLQSNYILRHPNGMAQGWFGGHFMGNPSNDFKDCKIYDFLYNSTGLLK